MTEITPKLGEILHGPEQRDAVHIAIYPAIADEKLAPGQDVGLIGSGERVGPLKPHFGIVDPFLNRLVCPGETVWILLYPGTVTNLRHSWSHTSVPDDDGSRDDDDDYDDGCRGC